MEIAIWSDGTWCELGEVAEFTYMSDDYEVVTVPDSVEDVDLWVADRG